MGVVNLSQDIEIVEREKSTDYLYDVLNELIERTGGRVVLTQRLVQAQRAPSGTETLYTVPTDATSATINNAVVIDTSGGVNQISLWLDTASDATLIYKNVSLAANTTTVIPLTGFHLTAGQSVLVNTAVATITLSLTELL